MRSDLSTGMLVEIGLKAAGAVARRQLRRGGEPAKSDPDGMLRHLGLSSLARLADKSLPVVYTSVFVPSEILQASEVAVLPVEVLSAVLAHAGAQRKCLSRAREMWVPDDACSFHRTCLGATASGLFPKPDLLVCSSQVCEVTISTFQQLKELTGAELLVLDVPTRDGRDARDYLTGQLQELVDVLTRLCGHPTGEDLRLAVEESNRARAAIVQAEALRSLKPAPRSSRVASDWFAVQQFGLGGGEAADLAEGLLEELRAAGPENEDSARLLWYHFRPYYDSSLLGILSTRGASVVVEPMVKVHWAPLRPEDALGSIADKLLANPLHGSFEREAEVVRDCCAEYGLDGAVCYVHGGCRQTLAALGLLKETLDQAHVPLLVLDGDCVDAEGAREEQNRTRLEAFLETLRH